MFITKWSSFSTNITKRGSFITKWGKHYYKVGLLCFIKNKGRSGYKVGQIICFKVRQLYDKVGQVLQRRASIITKQGSSALLKIDAMLLPSGASNFFQNSTIILTNWGRYYKVAPLYYYKAGQLLQIRAVHLRDNKANGDACLLIGPRRFEN